MIPQTTTIERFARLSGRFSFFSAEFLREAPRPPYRMRMFMEQAMRIGVMSMPVASLTAMFTGMVMVIQIGMEMSRFGAINYSAGITIRALCREMIPVFTGIVVGARVAAAMTAELGTMRVTEQLDAMTALSVRPMHYLVVPRVVMATLMMPIIAIYSGFLGFLGGWLVGAQVLNIPAITFLSTTIAWVEPMGMFTGLLKTVVFGFFMGIGGCFFGFETEGGAEGVGRATTQSVVFVILAILISDFIMSTWFVTLLTF